MQLHTKTTEKSQHTLARPLSMFIMNLLKHCAPKLKHAKWMARQLDKYSLKCCNGPLAGQMIRENDLTLNNVCWYWLFSTQTGRFLYKSNGIFV